jgi:uncharacterized protein YecE (DUF72 family)
MADGQIRIGIGGWTYPPWRGVFYPDKLPQTKELEYASSHLGAIEINATFYGRQARTSWEKWEQVVPEVMKPKLAEAGEGLAGFCSQGFAELGPKLGPILWQFASRRKFDRDDIAGFIDLLPTEVEGVLLRHAIEPRHESFRDEHFFDLCRARNIAIVFEDSDEYPCIEADTASFAYARLQRMSEDVATGYDTDAVDAFANRAREWQKQGRDAYIFMINGAKVRAPAAALSLQQRLAV